MKNPTTQGGKLFKQAQVGAALRERIVSGAYPPGSAIPTRSQLMAEFRVSVVTIQKAMDHLERDGFIQSKWGSGTFVADHPPHLSRYALAFPSRPDGVQYWTDWWNILRQAAATIARAEPEKKFVTYYEITGHADVEDYQRFLADARDQRLAGIIMLSGAHLLLRTPLLDDCPVPRVYIGGDLSRWNIPGVSTDLNSFLDRALGHAAKQARRRPVFLGPAMHLESTWEAWSGACRRYAMEPARRQLLSLPLYPHETPRHLTQTLMLLPPHLRPDTLVVGDDHFVEEVTAGLLTSGLPEDQWPTVIAHANFPKPPRALTPVTYLGYDSVSVIRACIDVLNAQRRGQTPPRITLIPATFASEQSNIEAPMPGSLALRDLAAD